MLPSEPGHAHTRVALGGGRASLAATSGRRLLGRYEKDQSPRAYFVDDIKYRQASRGGGRGGKEAARHRSVSVLGPWLTGRRLPRPAADHTSSRPSSDDQGPNGTIQGAGYRAEGVDVSGGCGACLSCSPALAITNGRVGVLGKLLVSRTFCISLALRRTWADSHDPGRK